MLNTCMKHYNAMKVREMLSFGQREVIFVGRAGEGVPGRRQHAVSSPGFQFVIIH